MSDDGGRFELSGCSGCFVGLGVIFGISLVVGGIQGACNSFEETTADNQEKNWKSVDESIANDDPLDPEPTGQEEKREPDVEVPEYSIIKEIESPAFSKTSIDVRLEERVESEEEIKTMAGQIRRAYGPEADRVFINYWLPDQEPGTTVSYATSHWNPHFSVVLHGSTRGEYQEREQETAKKDAQRQVLGRWESSNPIIDGYTFYEKDGSKYVERRMGDGSSGQHEVKVREKSGRKILQPVDGGQDYWVIE